MTAPTVRLRRRPLVVEAIEWDGTRARLKQLTAWTGRRFRMGPDGVAELYCGEEGQWVRCPVGHWIVKGALDEFWPVSADALAAAYEPEEAG